MDERSEVQFGLTRIAFEVRRSARRGTVALTVEPSGGLVVTAPQEVSLARLNDVVRHKALWVVQRLRVQADVATPPRVREFITGETVLYLGRQLRLRVLEADDVAAPRIWAGWYEVPIARGLPIEARRLEVRRRLVSSLKARALLYLPRCLADVCRAARVEPPCMFVREPRKRWGSCDSSGTLRINWRIVQAPPSLIAYVLAHELVHLDHRTHGPAFWSTLGQRMPDYEARRRRLRALGPSLLW